MAKNDFLKSFTEIGKNVLNSLWQIMKAFVKFLISIPEPVKYTIYIISFLCACYIAYHIYVNREDYFRDLF